MRLLLLAACLLVCCRPLFAAQKRITLYLDGARVEQEMTAVAGYLELPLPDAAVKGSLRVKPLGGSVQRVEIVPAEKDRRPAAELSRLEEKRAALLERMELLQTREEIFSAAAKSHASRAPRKSKNNPDPMGTIRQGAEYALGQLEQVQRARSRCRSALKAVDEEIRAARKGESLVRVWLSGKRARISYLRSGSYWTPCYDFRLEGNGEGELLLHARLPQREKGVQYLVSPGPAASAPTPAAVNDEFPLLWRRPLLLDRVAYRDGPHPSLSFGFKGVDGLFSGEASAYWRGEYLGSAPFPGGGAGELAFGAGR